MGGPKTPPAHIDQREHRFFPRRQAGEATDDNHVGPMVVRRRKALMVPDNDPILPAFRIIRAGRKLRPVILIERSILCVQP